MPYTMLHVNYIFKKSNVILNILSEKKKKRLSDAWALALF